MQIITDAVIWRTEKILGRLAKYPTGFYKHEPDYPSTYDINDGCCDDLANLVVEDLRDELPGIEVVWLEDLGFADISHCVVRYLDVYYDAECPDGVDSPAKIPFVLNMGKTRREVLIERLTTKRVLV